MLIQRLLLVFAATSSICASARAASSDPLATWFQSGRCAAFHANSPSNVSAPRSRRILGSHEGFWPNWLPLLGRNKTLTFLYDAKHGIALRIVDEGSVGGDLTLRSIGPPPTHVLQRDLTSVATRPSGIRIGTSVSTIVRKLAKLGTPDVVRACGGLENYAYRADEAGNTIDFTIKNGRVVEMSESSGD